MKISKALLFISIISVILSNVQASTNSTNSTNSTTDDDLDLLEKSLETVELTGKNFDNYSEENDLLIIYKARKCQSCHQFRKNFLDLAKYAKDNYNFTIATFQIDNHETLFKRLEARNNGILRIIKKGMSPGFGHFGYPSKEHLRMWFEKFRLPSLMTELNSVEDVMSFTKDSDTIIYIGNTNDKSYFVFDDLASKHYKIKFGNCVSKECVDHFKGDDATLVYFKNNSPVDRLHEGYELKTAIKWMIRNNLETVIDSSDDSVNLAIFTGVPIAILYTDSADNFEKHKALLAKVLNDRKTNNQQYIQGIISTIEHQGEKLRTSFKIKSSMLPTVVIFEVTKDGDNTVMSKYKLEDDTLLNEENIVNFFQEFKDGKLPRYYFSEDEPDAQDAVQDGIHKVVGNTFKKIVLDNYNDVMLFIGVPWCGYCRQFKTIYEALGRKLKYSKKLVLAKIDASENDLSQYIPNINGYPSILFWKGNDKSKYFTYDNERQVYLLQEFINKHGAYVSSIDDEL